MLNLAHRHRRAMRGQRLTPELRTYVILDSAHRPDLRGEFAGVKVERRGDKQFVKMPEAAARFYIDSGSIAEWADTEAM